MNAVIAEILKKKNIFSHLNEGITIATVANQHEGYGLAKAILYGLVDKKTVLYLSGGNTPKVLLEQLAHEERLLAGAVGMVDERYGEKFHEKSNEKMMQETGFLRYLQMRDIPFYPILQNKSREKTAEHYDEKLRTLNATYQKSVAILGIGADGHTSSIAPNRADPSAGSGQVFLNPMFTESQKHLLVSEFDDPKSFYGERVGMTFLGLSMLDILIILAFGSAKQNPLELMFKDGSEEEIPARFFKRSDIASKTIIITDQQI